MRKFILSGAIICGSAWSSGAMDVDPNVAHDCARLWGSDYHMQLFCRKQQMRAKDEIRLENFETSLKGDSSTQAAIANAKALYGSGVGKLNRSIDGCYSKATSPPEYKICIVMDTYAQIRTGAKGRNGAHVTEDRQIAQATRIFGKTRGKIVYKSLVGGVILAVNHDLYD